MWEHLILNARCAAPEDAFEAGMVGSGESFMTRREVGRVGWEQN